MTGKRMLKEWYFRSKANSCNCNRLQKKCLSSAASPGSRCYLLALRFDCSPLKSDLPTHMGVWSAQAQSGRWTTEGWKRVQPHAH